MKLAKHLHEHWSSSAALNGLLPVEKVFTGMSGDSALPYATISLEGAKPLSRHGDGSALDEVAVQIELFHGGYDAGLAVLKEIEAAFERLSLDLDEGRKMLDMRRGDRREKPLDAETWRFALDFRCTVFLPEGV
ncbi:MAG: DUF3168 domain-containing protein [Pirellulales bacterium]|nr:DUF3168 domain-containing protein [Pirellulales bacterium]